MSTWPCDAIIYNEGAPLGAGAAYSCPCKAFVAAPASVAATGNEPMPTYGLNDDYPEMWEAAQQYDFAERLGGSSSKLLAEIDGAMRELWEARRARA